MSIYTQQLVTTDSTVYGSYGLRESTLTRTEDELITQARLSSTDTATRAGAHVETTSLTYYTDYTTNGLVEDQITRSVTNDPLGDSRNEI